LNSQITAFAQPPAWDYLRKDVQEKHIMAQKRGIEAGTIVLYRKGAKNRDE